MADTFKGIITADGKKRQLSYGNILELPVSDETLSIQGAFADAKTVGDKFTEVKTETSLLREDIDDLSSSKITKFYASNLGETHITDSDDGKMADMKLYGRSEQKQYSGKNLAKLVDVSVSDKRYYTVTLVKGQKYTLQSVLFDGFIGIYKEKQIAQATQVILNWGTSYNGSTTFTSEIDGECYLCIWYAGANVPDESKVKCMLEKGSEAHAYEPYTGDQPSPSPDYPQEIKSVVNPTVKVWGKNLLNPTLQTTTQNGVTCTNNGDGTYTLNGTASKLIDMNLSTNFHIENGKTYRMTGWVNGASGFIYLINGNGDARDTGDGVTFTYNSATTDSKVIHIQIPANTVLSNVTIKPMICTDTSATYDDFEPYHEQTVILPYTLNAIPVSSGGNVTIDGQQYISDYVDVERGKLVRRVGNAIFQGAQNEAWTLWNENNDNLWSFMFQLGVKDFVNESDSRCNRFKFNSNESVDISYWLCRPSNNASIQIKYRTVGKDVTAFKTWLSRNPVVVQYVLATPTETDLTPEEIAAFKALATYYPTTNISVTSEQLDGYTVFNYPVSMENGWNYVKQQLNDNRDYIYDMDLQSAEAYVNSEYAVVLTELEV